MRLIGDDTVPVERRVVRIAIAGIFCTGIWIVAIASPTSLPFPACMFHALTGHSCMTCGMTRSLHAIAHGNWGESIRYHLFGPAVFIGMVLCIGISAAEAIGGRRLVGKFWGGSRRYALTSIAVAWAIYWGVRLFTE